jgi:pimeloyl-ACP methyl ester carboxylesterase
MTEFVTAPDGVRIAYDIAGEGASIVLVHGFGASRVQNWRAPGWYETLTGAGHRVIALDCRGHGESDKPHDSAFYGESTMANDVALVMQATGYASAFVMGYSMGGSLTIRLLHDQAERAHAAVIGGVGANYFTRSNDWRTAIADGLVAEDISKLSPTQRMFREFAFQPGKDVRALAACMRAPRAPLRPEELAAIRTPALVVCGEMDSVSGPPEPLASALGKAQAVTVPKRDHMLTVGDKIYKQAVTAFLSAQAMD